MFGILGGFLLYELDLRLKLSGLCLSTPSLKSLDEFANASLLMVLSPFFLVVPVENKFSYCLSLKHVYNDHLTVIIHFARKGVA